MNKVDKILKKCGSNVNDISDITANQEPSFLFYILGNRLSFLFKDDPEEVLSEKGMKRRVFLNKVIKKLGPSFLQNQQVIVKRSELVEGAEDFVFDENEKPVIWAGNHWFKDDTLATVLAAKRNAYIMFGSLPQFFNSPDGLTAFTNGVILINRKNRNSKRTSMPKAVAAMNMGKDLLIFPEGCLNQTYNKLLLYYWPGIYRIATEVGCKVYPVIHYINDPHNPSKDMKIYTVYGNPVSFEGLSEEEGLRTLRDEISTWYYLLMEKYGQSTRKELLGDKTPMEYWDDYINTHRLSATKYFDYDYELRADYRPKNVVRPETVWQSVADIKNFNAGNINHILYARQLVELEKSEDIMRKDVRYVTAEG